MFVDDGELMSGAGMAGLTYFASNEDDPYITIKNIVSCLFKDFTSGFLYVFDTFPNCENWVTENEGQKVYPHCILAQPKKFLQWFDHRR